MNNRIKNCHFNLQSNFYIYSEYLYGLVEAAGLVIERDVANWIANQGGWVGYLFLLGNIFYSKILLQK